MAPEEISGKSWIISKTVVCLFAVVHKFGDLASAAKHVHEIVDTLKKNEKMQNYHFAKFFEQLKKRSFYCFYSLRRYADSKFVRPISR